MKKYLSHISLILLLIVISIYFEKAFAQNPEGIFCHFQYIPTQGAEFLKSFKIGGETFLAVANRENDGLIRNVNASIYRYDGTHFIPFQSIPTIGASGIESFIIDGQTYLAISCYGTNCGVYKWNGSEFIAFQSIDSLGGASVKSFKISGQTYLAVANAANNYYNNPQHNVDSKIYKWNGSFFSEFQSIPTSSAYDWESFSVGDKTYLIVANYFNNYTRLINSKLYEFNGSAFVEIQSIPTIGAFDWESFKIGNQIFLAVANHGNDSGTYVNSAIYKWDENSSSLIPFQYIETKGASSWKSFTLGGEFYLAVSNDGCCYTPGNFSYNIESKIFKWNGSLFIEELSIPTHGASSWEPFVIDNINYLAVGNCYNGSSYQNDSEIFKFCGIADSDGDGIPDAEDKCPNQDARGYDADRDGCIDSLDGLEQLIETLLDEDAIDKKLYKKLLEDDEKAIKSFEKDKICKAINDLEKLNKDVDKQIDKKISNDDAALITDYSNNVIQWLLESLPEGHSCK
jgi:hypothetical protein